jgi:hypothetical protein
MRNYIQISLNEQRGLLRPIENFKKIKKKVENGAMA